MASIRWVIPATLLLATISSVIAEYGNGISQVALAEAEVPVVGTAPAAQPAAAAPAAAPAAETPALPGIPAAAPAPLAPRAAPATPPAVPPVPAPAALPSAAPPAGLPPPAAIVPGTAPSAAEPAATPRSRAKSSEKNLPANKVGSRVPGKTRSGPVVVAILPLQNNNADSVLRMLESLLAHDELAAVKTTVDSQSNSLVLRGTVEDIEKVREVVQQLDRQQTQPQPGYVGPVNVPAPRTPTIPYITSPDGAQWPVPHRAYTLAEVKLHQEFAKLDNQSVDLARQYRQDAETLGSEHPEQKRRRNEITSAVSKAFDARQDIQTQELKQLKERLAKVEDSIGKRSKNREEIIAKRVRDLLEDDRDLEWNAANRVNGNFLQPQPATYPSKLPQAQPLYPSQAATVLPPVLPSNPMVGQTSPDTDQVQKLAGQYLAEAQQAAQQAAVVDQRIHLAPSQILGLSPSDPNQPAGADQRQALETAQEKVLREESKVAALKKKLSESGRPVALEEDAEYLQALRDLESAKRQLGHAKREADTVLKLLTLDLELAKAEKEAAEAELQATNRLPKDARPDETLLRKSSAAVRQAQLRVERAQTLLEHHSSMMKSTEKDSEQAVPSTTPTRR